VVEKLSALTKRALEGNTVKEAFDKQSATRIWMSPADAAAYRAADDKRLAPISTASGAKVE
jgi:tripartite-type tricarboxylate transporter receptor subunit TctC